MAMGTSVGTIAALTPIAVGISEKTGISGALCVGAAVCGAMFGDNLSMISDTTIAAARTQGARMKDKFKENIYVAIPAAIITMIIFLIMGWNSKYELTGKLDYNVFQILPYIAVLVAAVVGINVFIVLMAGTILSAFVGLCSGSVNVLGIVEAMGSGITNMYDIVAISIIVAGIIGIVQNNGGIDYILYHIRKLVKGRKGAQFGIAILSVLVDASTANNTVAIVMAGPIAKNIADEYDIKPRRSAAILDIFTSVCQGIIPYGAQLLYASAGAAAVNMKLSPVEIMPYLFYPILLGACGIIYIIVRTEKMEQS